VAKATPHEGLRRYPDAARMKVFLAMTLHNLGDTEEAVQGLLMLLAGTSSDPGIRNYRTAIEFYAGDVDRAWPG